MGRNFGRIAVVIALLAIIGVIIPVWLIQPFRPQTPTALSIAYSLRRVTPWITLAGLIAMILAIPVLWRTGGKLKKGLLVLLMIFLGGVSWFARQNHFEWMFHPIAHKGFAAASQAKYPTDSDIVMAIDINHDAVAYPVRAMAYHHIVNDVVGGIPVVSTY